MLVCDADDVMRPLLEMNVATRRFDAVADAPDADVASSNHRVRPGMARNDSSLDRWGVWEGIPDSRMDRRVVVVVDVCPLRCTIRSSRRYFVARAIDYNKLVLEIVVEYRLVNVFVMDIVDCEHRFRYRYRHQWRTTVVSAVLVANIDDATHCPNVEMVDSLFQQHYEPAPISVVCRRDRADQVKVPEMGEQWGWLEPRQDP